MAALEDVKKYVGSLPWNLEVIEFDVNTHTSQLAADALGVEVAQIAKSMLLVSNDSAILVVTSGDKKIDHKKIKQTLGIKVRFANTEEVEKYTGYLPGGVCPFLIKEDIPIYLDKSMKRYSKVYTSAGTDNTVLPITFEQLKSVTSGIECDFCI